MALRDFTDHAGRSWTVWAVRPTSDLRLRSTPSSPSAQPDHHDLLRHGWLVFETAGQRRRLVPIPENWEVVDEQTLEQLCARAEQVPPRRRLLD